MDNKRIKAINERLAYLERTGRTDTKYYKDTVAIIKALKIDTMSRKGTIRISRSKEVQQTLTNEILNKLDKKSSMKKEIKWARKYLKEQGIKATNSEIESIINDKDLVQSKLEDMLIEIYRKKNNNLELSEPETKIDIRMQKDINGQYTRWQYKDIADIIREMDEKEKIRKHSILEQIRELDKYN